MPKINVVTDETGVPLFATPDGAFAASYQEDKGGSVFEIETFRDAESLERGQKRLARQQALSKLSEEEKAALGLNKKAKAEEE